MVQGLVPYLPGGAAATIADRVLFVVPRQSVTDHIVTCDIPFSNNIRLTAALCLLPQPTVGYASTAGGGAAAVCLVIGLFSPCNPVKGL